MYQSSFSYTLSRPYPYRWFTPLAFCLGVLATIVLSMLNFASNAYQLQTVYTTSPNETLRSNESFNQLPWSWTNRMQASCQAANLPVGTELFTNKSGLSYTLDKIATQSSGTHPTKLPALQYLEYPIGNCEVDTIVIEFQRADTAVASGGWWSWRKTQATASTTCNIETNHGALAVTLSTIYTAHIDNLQYLVNSQSVDEPGNWWAAQIVNAYYLWMTQRMSQSTPWNDTEGAAYDYSRMVLTTDPAGSFQDHSRFDFYYEWQQSDGVYANSNHPHVFETNERNLAILYNTGPRLVPNVSGRDTTFPDVGNEIEGFAAGLYSLILNDLGQQKTSTILTDSRLLERYLQAADNEHEAKDKYSMNNTYLVAPDPFNNISIANAWNSLPWLHSLGTNPSVLYSQYVCSIPVKKDIFSIVMSILVADLVFLSALWQALNWATVQYLEKHDDKAKYCQGCMQTAESAETLTNGYTILGHDDKSDKARDDESQV